MILFQDLYKDYLKQIKDKVSDSTIKTYLYRLKAMEKALPVQDVTKIDMEMVQKSVDGLYDAYEPKTIHAIYDAFRAVMDDAKRKGIICKNPCEDVRLPVLDKPKRRKRLSMQELQTFLVFVAPYRDIFLPAYIACQTGLGRSDVLNLKWLNIDFQNQKINMEKSVISKDSQSVIKTKNIPMANQLSELLYIEKGRRKQEKRNVEEEYVCQTVTGGIMKPEYFDRRFRKFVSENKDRFPDDLQFKDLSRMNLFIRGAEMLSDNTEYESFQIIPQHYIVDSSRIAA